MKGVNFSEVFTSHRLWGIMRKWGYGGEEVQGKVKPCSAAWFEKVTTVASSHSLQESYCKMRSIRHSWPDIYKNNYGTLRFLSQSIRYSTGVCKKKNKPACFAKTLIFNIHSAHLAVLVAILHCPSVCWFYERTFVLSVSVWTSFSLTTTDPTVLLSQENTDDEQV